VLPFELAEKNPDTVQRFFREGQLAARVTSPHLLAVLDVNEESGLFYIVMEYVAGKSGQGYLRDVIKTGAMGLDEAVALDLCIAACTGLAAAHAKGIIHRDVKPDNIMIPRDEQTQDLDIHAAKLADLGLARSDTLDRTAMTQSGACMGTPGFAAPEQIGDAKTCGKPADVFSMGATLYALLTGRSPFAGSVLFKILKTTIDDPHAPVASVRPDISAPTAELLDRCLAKEPDARYVDAAALLAALMVCRAVLGEPAQTQMAVERVSALLNAKEVGQPITALADADPRTRGSGNLPLPNIPDEFGARPGTTQPPFIKPDRPWIKPVAAVILFALLAGGVLGYQIWQKEQERQHELQVAEEQRKAKETRLAEVRQALDSALKTAQEAQTAFDWSQVLEVLKGPLADLGDNEHTTKQDAIELVRLARTELAMRADFIQQLDSANAQMKDGKFDGAKAAFEAVRTRWLSAPPAEKTKIAVGVKACDDGLCEKRYSNALDAGTKALAAENWSEAEKQFQLALAEKPGDQVVQKGNADAKAGAERQRKAVEDAKREEDRKRQIAEEAKLQLVELRRSLDVALGIALEAKKSGEWERVVTALEKPIAALDKNDHTTKETAINLLQQAKAEVKKRKEYDALIAEANGHLAAEEWPEAEKNFEAANTLTGALDENAQSGLQSARRGIAFKNRASEYDTLIRMSEEKLKEANVNVHGSYDLSRVSRSMIWDNLTKANNFFPNSFDVKRLRGKVMDVHLPNGWITFPEFDQPNEWYCVGPNNIACFPFRWKGGLELWFKFENGKVLYSEDEPEKWEWVGSEQHSDAGRAALKNATIGNRPQSERVIYLDNEQTAFINRLGIPAITGMASINEIGKCTELSYLGLMGSDMTNLDPLSDLKRLEVLRTKSTFKLTDITGIAGCTRLTSLELHGPRTLSLSPLSNLKLRHLSIFSPSSFRARDIDAVANIKGLQTLNLEVEDTQDCSFFSKLTELNTLSLWSGKLSAKSLSQLPYLTNLALHFVDLQQIASLGDLQSLSSLELYSIRSLENLDGIKRLRRLRSLNLDCGNIADISALRNLSGLRELVLNGSKITDFSVLAELPKLESLKLPSTISAGQMAALAEKGVLIELKTLSLPRLDEGFAFSEAKIDKFKNLSSLTIEHAKVGNLEFLRELKGFEEVEITWCEDLVDVTALTESHNLKFISLYGCTKLKDIACLKTLPNLRVLSLQSCESLTDADLDGFKGFPALRDLYLNDCKKLSKAKIKELRDAMTHCTIHD